MKSTQSQNRPLIFFYISLSQGDITHMLEYLITFSLGTKMQWYDYANKIESIGIMGVWQPALSILIGGLTAAFTTAWIGFGISAATTIFLSAHL